MYLWIDRFDFYGMPRQPISIVHCMLLIGYKVNKHFYIIQIMFKSQ
nr:MAG TPA_asm: hypothetical protein [Caudoviricetes sp.]